MIKQVFFNSSNFLEDVIAFHDVLSSIHVECFEKFTTKELTYKLTIQSISDRVVPCITTKVVDKLKDEYYEVIKNIDINNKNGFSTVYITFNEGYNFISYADIFTYEISRIDKDLFI